MGARGAKGAKSAKGARGARGARGAESAKGAWGQRLSAHRRIRLIRNVPMLVADHSRT